MTTEVTLSDKQRLFVAVPLPDELFAFVRQAQAMLPRFSGLRLCHEEQFHVTLAFIGEVGQGKARAAREVVRALPGSLGGDAILGGFAYFPSPKRARVVALEIADGQGVFAGLFEHVMSGLESAGVMQREKRPFRPHLTVARLRMPGLVQPRSESGQGAFAVESVCLYESKLKREGAEYTVLERSLLCRAENGQELDISQVRRSGGKG